MLTLLMVDSSGYEICGDIYVSNFHFALLQMISIEFPFSFYIVLFLAITTGMCFKSLNYQCWKSFEGTD